MRMEDTIEIDATREAIWPWLTEIDRQKQWMKGLVSREWTEGQPDAPGSKFRVVIKEGGRDTEYNGTMLAIESPDHFRSTMTGGCGKEPYTMHFTYKLADLGGRRTRVDYLCEFEMPKDPGFFMRLMIKFGTWFARRQSRSFHAKLKSLAESSAS
ncbi:MAG: SRPBCC family protein [Planctomycetota bacterium]